MLQNEHLTAEEKFRVIMSVTGGLVDGTVFRNMSPPIGWHLTPYKKNFTHSVRSQNYVQQRADLSRDKTFGIR